MRRVLLRLIGLLAVAAAAMVGWVLATLPPAAERPAVPAAAPDIVSGAYHVHSTRSDGSGSVDAIAAAAAAAGLRFVILTDHGDATRPADPPAYRLGVLCLDAVEVNSEGGHLVALGLRGPSPYPLAGDTRDVLEDIHRLGGWAIAAHPDSPRPGLRWQAGGAPVDGVEWLNADSEWRGRPKRALLAAAARAWFRPPESVASLFGSGRNGIAAWSAASAARPTFSIAALDAHARFGEDTDEGRTGNSVALKLPDYETMFRTVTQTVRLDRPLSGEAGTDADAVLSAITAGRSYSVIRAFVDVPHALSFEAATSAGRVALGGAIGQASPVTVRASVPAATGARLVLFRNDAEVASGEQRVEVLAAEPGAYRVEARLPGRAMPWIVSNAIRVGGDAAAPEPAAADREEPPQTAPIVAIPPEAWVIEAHPSSTAAIGLDGGALRLQYRLGAGVPAGQYVALATNATGETAVDRVVFTASSRRPMRLSVQIRLPGGANGQRWRRSVYVDETPRRLSVALADLDPVDRRSPLRPISARVQSVLLVIDTLNARPGDSGELTLTQAGFTAGRPAPAGAR